MSVVDLVRAETGLDLRDTDFASKILAPVIGGPQSSLSVLLRDVDRTTDAVRSVMNTYRGLIATTTIAGAVGLAATTVREAYVWLQGRARETRLENLERRAKTRAQFVARYLGDDQGRFAGYWARVCSSVRAPTPKDLDLTRGVKDPRKHLDQYDRDYVWHASRVARSQVLNPTWSCPPYDDPGVTPQTWRDGVSYDRPSLLGGHTRLAGVVEYFWDRPAATGAIPKKYEDKYWGNAPNKPGADSESPVGDFGADWTALDSGVFSGGYAPAPGYTYLIGPGTYPLGSWYGAPGGEPVSPIFDVCAELGVLHIAMMDVTPIHACVDARSVMECYRHFLRQSGIRELPLRPRRQVEGGVWLDPDTLLPTSQVPNLPVVQTAERTGYLVPWEQLCAIELAFRTFFRVRRAALFQWRETSDSFKAAAKDSRDPSLRALAQGGDPPTYSRWVEADPLGDGWIPADAAGEGPDREEDDKGLPATSGGNGGGGGGGGAALAVVGGLAALGLAGGVAYALRRGRRR